MTATCQIIVSAPGTSVVSVSDFAAMTVCGKPAASTLEDAEGVHHPLCVEHLAYFVGDS